jgi:predicted dehydrogenase
MSSTKTIRWGIIGTGKIARDFAYSLSGIPNTQLLAIASRTLAKAQEYAAQYKVLRAYGSYEEMLNDGEIDVVYVATPHARHKDDCIMCLQAGKAVLCEKPFTVNAQEAKEVIAIAREKQLFCMEAMWMRFLPLIIKVQDLVNNGTIGKVRRITADFGYPAEFNPEGRLFNLNLGGGALLDRGVYPLSLAFMLLGTPTGIATQASIGETGVDEQSAMILSYPQGELAILSASLRSETSNEAVIIGTKGEIKLHAPFYKPHRLSIKQFSEEVIVSSSESSGLKAKIKQNKLLNNLYYQLDSYIFPLIRSSGKDIFQPIQGNGYGYEAAEVVRCLQNGLTESKIMPLDETVKILEAVDAIRSQWK